MDVFKKNFFLLKYLTTLSFLILALPLATSASQQFTTTVDFSYQKDELKSESDSSKRWEDQFRQEYNTSHSGYIFHPGIFPLDTQFNFSTSKLNNQTSNERKIDNYYFQADTTILPVTRFPIDLDFSHNLKKETKLKDMYTTAAGLQWNLNFDYFPTTSIFARNQRTSSYSGEGTLNSYGFKMSKDESKEIIFGRTRFLLSYSGGAGGGSRENQGEISKSGTASNSLNFSSVTDFSSRSNFEQGLNYDTTESLNENQGGSSTIDTGAQHINYKSLLKLNPNPYSKHLYGYKYTLSGFGSKKNINHNGQMSISKILSSRLGINFSSGYGFSQSSNENSKSERTSLSANAGAHLKLTNYLGSGYSLFVRSAESTNSSTVTGLNRSNAFGTNASLNYGRQFFKLFTFSNSVSGAISKSKTRGAGLEDSESKSETISNSGSLGAGKEVLRIVFIGTSGGYSLTKGKQADITPEQATLDMDRDSKSYNYSFDIRNKVAQEYISINADYVFTQSEQKINDIKGRTIDENFNRTYSLNVGIPYFESIRISGNYKKAQKAVNSGNEVEDSQDYSASFGFSTAFLGGFLSTNSNYMKREIESYASQNLMTSINYKRSLTRSIFGDFNVVRSDTWDRGIKEANTNYTSRITYQLRRWSIGFNYEYSINEDYLGKKYVHTYIFTNITRTFFRSF